MPKFEVFFTNTTKSKVVIEADDIEKAQESFYKGHFDESKVEEIESWESDITEIEELD